MPEPVFHGGGLALAVARHGGQPEDWLDLSTGINPVAPSLPPVLATDWARLPDTDLEQAACDAARQFYGFGERAAVLPIAGIQGVIPALPHLRDDNSCAILSPTYGEYSAAFRTRGCAVQEISSPDGASSGVAIVVNPNNPDGRVHQPSDLLAFCDWMVERGGLLVVDEAFGEVMPELTLAGQAGRPGLLVLKSFGKFFGLAGIRLGFAAGHADDIARLRLLLGAWGVSGPALRIGAELLRSADQSAMTSAIRDRAAKQVALFVRHGIALRADCGLFQLAAPVDAAALHHHLCERCILTRPFADRLDQLRFGLCADDDSLARLDRALSEFAG